MELLTEIDMVTGPQLMGKPPEQVLQILERHCNDTAVLLMKINNAVIELQRQVRDSGLA